MGTGGFRFRYLNIVVVHVAVNGTRGLVAKHLITRLTHPDPDESMLAAVTAIEAIQGPFAPKVVKRAMVRLLAPQGRAKAVAAEPSLTELFRVQAAYALLDKYFDQVDQAVKAEV